MTHRGRQFFLVNWWKNARYIRSHRAGGAENGGNSRIKVVRPTSEKCAVALPMRKPNAAYRSREHLTEREVERLIDAAKDNRWGHRDATMVLLAFRHGLRASELIDLRWEQMDLENAIVHVRRVKQGTPATHPLTGRELRALRRLQREQGSRSPFIFVSERGAPPPPPAAVVARWWKKR